MHAREFPIRVINLPRRRENAVGAEHAVVRAHDEQALNLGQSSRHRLQALMQLRAPLEPLRVAETAEEIEHAHEKHFVRVEYLQRMLARDAHRGLQSALGVVEGLPIEQHRHRDEGQRRQDDRQQRRSTQPG